jgi:guanine nucleotide-binding protein G(I)/G(S)/G(T) subunit beta-1
MSKRDKTGLMQTVKTSGATLAPLRVPPSQLKCRRKLQGHFGKITAMDWSADGNTIVSASQDGNLLLWDAFSTSKKQDVRLKSSYVMSVCMEQTTGEFVAAGGLDNACSVYSVSGDGDAKSQLKTELVSHEGYLATCKFFHSPSKMLTGSADSTCLLWDVNRGQIIDTYAEHSANIIEIELVGQNNFLSTSVDKTIKLWDTRTSASNDGSVQTFTGHKADVNGITLLKSSNGTTFATCSEDGTIRVWDMRSYGEISQFGEIMDPSECDPFSDGDAGFTSITSSASGRLLYVGHSEGTVECYDILQQPIMDRDPMYMLPNAHETHVSCIGVSPTGDALCTGSWDTQLKLFA